MTDSIKDKWNEAERTGEPVEVGDIVVCDSCDEDYTNSDAKGGFIFSGSAYCPSCAEKALPRIRGYGEEHYIKARCGPDTTFADFVRQYRGPDAYIQVREIPKKVTK